MKPSDLLLMAVTHDHKLIMVITPKDSVIEYQLCALFNMTQLNIGEKFNPINLQQSNLLIPVRLLLEQLGIEISPQITQEQELLELMRVRFDDKFPQTRQFSTFARKIHNEPDIAIQDPDKALINWMDTEEILFRILERYMVSQQLQQGFGDNNNDVDSFIKFSLSVHNRRKARAGHTFEHHIEAILQANQIPFRKGVITENKHKPDFIFPNGNAYHDPAFHNSKLNMLGAKTSCKDRWRQVLTEANRIKNKHLITLQPAISEEQTEQMAANNLKLVVPTPIQPTYSQTQQRWLLSFSQFIQNMQSIYR